jgi:hypothetical protein
MPGCTQVGSCRIGDSNVKRQDVRQRVNARTNPLAGPDTAVRDLVERMADAIEMLLEGSFMSGRLFQWKWW